MKNMFKRSKEIVDDNKLVNFIYILGRDHLTLGRIELIFKDHVSEKKTIYSNGWLANWAQDLAKRLEENNSKSSPKWKAVQYTKNGKFFMRKNKKLIHYSEDDGHNWTNISIKKALKLGYILKTNYKIKIEEKT